MSNTVNPQQILQALALRMAAQRGQGSLSGIPGAANTPPFQATPQATPQASPQAQGAIPNPAPAPQPQVQSQGGAARQLSPASPTPFNGTFGDRRGIISQLVNSAEKKGHDKKVNEAEMYYNQINSFLASGQPGDQQKAQQLLDDPKVRKILKTGLDYVPLEEDVPPEAIGVHQAQQQINKKQSALSQIKQMLSGGRQQGNAQPRPQGRAIIPQASQEAQQKYQLGEAKTGTELAHAQEYKASGEAKTAMAEIEKEKADAEILKAKADVDQAKAYADNATEQGKLYGQQAKDLKDTNPSKVRELNAHSNEMDASADYYRMLAKYGKNGKLPAAKIQDLMKAARADAVTVLRGYISDNKDAAKAVSKDTGYLLGPRSGLVKQQDQAAKKAQDLKRAIAWFDSDGQEAVSNGKMTPPQAAAQMYRMAGIEPPVPSQGPNGSEAPTSTDDEIMNLLKPAPASPSGGE